MFAFFAAVFVFYMYVSTIFSYWYVCIRLFSVFVFARFLFHEICVCETLCKFLNVYASLKCMFMQSIMINRKLCGNFRLFCPFAANVLSFYFFVSSFSLCFDYSEENENRNEKAVFLPILPENVRFCRK